MSNKFTGKVYEGEKSWKNDENDTPTHTYTLTHTHKCILNFKLCQGFSSCANVETYFWLHSRISKQ